MRLAKTLSRTQSKVLLIANVFGAVLYLFAASRGGWAIPQERAAGINVTTGEPFVWFLSILPIIAVFFVLDLGWAVKLLVSRDGAGCPFWLLSAAAWLVAVVIDFAHH